MMCVKMPTINNGIITNWTNNNSTKVIQSEIPADFNLPHYEKLTVIGPVIMGVRDIIGPIYINRLD